MSLTRPSRRPEGTTTMSHQLVGPWVLATVAVGLACFGLFSLAQPRYREIDVPDHGGA